MAIAEETQKTPEYKTKDVDQKFITDVIGAFGATESEISERNSKITERDEFVYGERLEKSLDIPIGHDFTPVNWLKRTVEIHKNMFMGRGFNVVSTYDSQNPEMAADDKDKERITIENKKEKEYAESRKRLIDSIIEDNGGTSLWAMLAETAGAIGDAAVKTYYDEDDKKFVISPIESIDNLRVLWARDDFRKKQAVAYVYQITLQEAIEDYGVPQDTPTSTLGNPLVWKTDTQTPANTYSNQRMVTVLEVTGKIDGWASENGKLKKVMIGKETELNALIVGNKKIRIIDEETKMPRYYIFPNKRQRRRPWGESDITDAAIDINLTYIETLSDWRTHASKVNFQKYKAFGFGPDVQLPKNEARKVQIIPLAEGQDMVRLDQGDSNQLDFRAQLDECKEQFVRETGISRVLFDDPSVTLNSNQALLTSMKPTSDIAEAKKQLWSPILVELFMDALETIAAHQPKIKDLIGENFSLKVMWPSLMQKEDPVFQQMLLNRFNANTMSLQSYLEAQGESKEEIDRIRDELDDPVTAAILGRIVNVMAQNLIAPPQPQGPEVKTNISLRGDLTPQQEANHATKLGIQDGPFPPSMGPQGNQGMIAYENQDNAGFTTGAYPNQQPVTRGPDGQPVGMQPSDTNTGQQAPAQITSPANNQEGQGVMSQPGSGATTTSPQGALNQQQQQAGR